MFCSFLFGRDDSFQTLEFSSDKQALKFGSSTSSRLFPAMELIHGYSEEFKVAILLFFRFSVTPTMPNRHANHDVPVNVQTEEKDKQARWLLWYRLQHKVFDQLCQSSMPCTYI